MFQHPQDNVTADGMSNEDQLGGCGNVVVDEMDLVADLTL